MIYKSDFVTWLSGGTKIFPSEERNSKEARSNQSAHFWETTASTHAKAWENTQQSTKLLCIAQLLNVDCENLPTYLTNDVGFNMLH